MSLSRATRPAHRQALAAALGLGLAILPGAGRAGEREVPWTAQIRLLSGVWTVDLAGTLRERLDPGRGAYEVHIRGRGRHVKAVIESTGVVRGDRWAPRSTRMAVTLYGRHWESDTRWDLDAGTVAFHSRGESFFVRRRRRTDDVLALPPGTRVDDVVSSSLNFAEGRWPPDGDGVYRTHLVRSSAAPRPGSDGQRRYRAELRPLALRTRPASGSGRTTALFDLTGFSSWALADAPARIEFGGDRRLDEIALRLRLGTSVRVRFVRAAPPRSHPAGPVPAASGPQPPRSRGGGPVADRLLLKAG